MVPAFTFIFHIQWNRGRYYHVSLLWVFSASQRQVNNAVSRPKYRYYQYRRNASIQFEGIKFVRSLLTWNKQNCAPEVCALESKANETRTVGLGTRSMSMTWLELKAQVGSPALGELSFNVITPLYSPQITIRSKKPDAIRFNQLIKWLGLAGIGPPFFSYLLCVPSIFLF